MTKRKKLNSGVLIIFFGMTSLFSLIYILMDTNKPSYYSYLWILPLAYLIVTLIFLSRWSATYLKTITGTIIIIIYYIRLVVTPFIMALGQYSSIIDEEVYRSRANSAIVLMAYEVFLVFLFLTSFIQKMNRIYGKTNIKNDDLLLEYKNRPSRALWVIVGLMVLFIVYLIQSDPTIWKANFLLLIDVNQTYYAFSNADTGIGTLSMYVELMNSVFKLIQVILPPMLLYIVARRNIDRRVKYFIAFILFSFVVVIATEDRIDAIFAGIALLFTIRDVFGTKFRHKFSILLVIIGATALFGLAIKSGVASNEGNGSGLKGLSSMFVAYFSGIPTVAVGMNMADALPGLNFLHVFPDAVSKIPYFTYIISMFTGVNIVNSNQLMNNYIHEVLGRGYAQIMPSIALGYEYVGFFFAPVLVIIFIKLALYFERQIKVQKNIVRRNLYYWITICVASSPVISSVLLITAKISWFMIAMILLVFLQRQRENADLRKNNYLTE